MNEEEFDENSCFELHFPHQLIRMEFFLCVLHLYPEKVVIGSRSILGLFSEAKELWTQRTSFSEFRIQFRRTISTEWITRLAVLRTEV